MAKLNILGIDGNKTKEISARIFDGNIREDLIQKIAEIERLEERQPYAPFHLAGMQTSASGNVKHNRHVWKTDRGKGMGRFPKKRMSDKGERFVWVAAVAPGTRGGRRAHPPKILGADWKINRKERILGMLSALALISSSEKIKEKYSSLSNKDIKIKLPLIVDSKILSLNTKDFFNSLNKILGQDLMTVALQDKNIRPGKGKMRGRLYKKNAGLLVILGNNQEKKIHSIDVVKAKDLKLKDIAFNGARISIFTEEAVKDLENKLFGKSEDKK